MYAVMVQSSNSSPTVTGPFETSEDAERWAHAEELTTPGVTRADAVAMGDPHFDATTRQPAKWTTEPGPWRYGQRREVNQRS